MQKTSAQDRRKGSESVKLSCEGKECNIALDFKRFRYTLFTAVNGKKPLGFNHYRPHIKLNQKENIYFQKWGI